MILRLLIAAAVNGEAMLLYQIPHIIIVQLLVPAFKQWEADDVRDLNDGVEDEQRNQCSARSSSGIDGGFSRQ
jgi:hypothetical protein